MQPYQDGLEDRQANLLRGLTLLESDMTVSAAGLKDGDGLSLFWSDRFIEMASWTGEEMDQNLYVRIPAGSTCIEDRAFRGCKSLKRVLIPNSVTLPPSGDFSYFFYPKP